MSSSPMSEQPGRSGHMHYNNNNNIWKYNDQNYDYRRKGLVFELRLD